MQITALVESPDHVCCRYRLAAFSPYLTQAGHRLDFRPLPRRPWHWLGLASTLAHVDVVIVQRKLLWPWQLYLLRRGERMLILDFDDAVFLRDSYASRGLHSARRLRSFANMLRGMDCAVAGNHYLADFSRSWSRHSVVIPTCVDPLRYPQAKHTRARQGVELVWIGSSSTLRGLEAVQPLLEKIGQENPGTHLKLVCDRFLELQHLHVRPCHWTEAGEAGALAEADIGISWIPDDLWSRGKCGLKVLQYMAAGLPVIANPVGVQERLVRDGETGYLARTPDEWSAAVARLAADPALRRRLGERGRALVEKEYSVTAGASRWLDLLDSLQEQRAARAGGKKHVKRVG